MSPAEREVWTRGAISFRMPDGAIVRWTGERYRKDMYLLADDGAVDLPPATHWTLARTLLPNGRACKRWRSGESEPEGYNLGTWVQLETVDVAPGARGLFQLFKLLGADRGACLL